jgi:hypothetical protein
MGIAAVWACAAPEGDGIEEKGEEGRTESVDLPPGPTSWMTLIQGEREGTPGSASQGSMLPFDDLRGSLD